MGPLASSSEIVPGKYTQKMQRMEGAKGEGTHCATKPVSTDGFERF
jgi:hypothetical protein